MVCERLPAEVLLQLLFFAKKYPVEIPLMEGAGGIVNICPNQREKQITLHVMVFSYTSDFRFIDDMLQYGPIHKFHCLHTLYFSCS